MQELKATQAREIDKASVTEAETLFLEDALSPDPTKPVMQEGDFYFRANLVVKADDPPTAFFKRLIWKLTGKPYTITERIVYTIVISCPFCGLPIMTSLAQHISSKRPLTIAEPIACPYSAHDIAKAHSFRITEGNIIAV
jgi:hypothetical protein